MYSMISILSKSEGNVNDKRRATLDLFIVIK